MFELGQLLESVPDPRRAGFRQKYRLCDVLMLALCAVLSGANSFTEMAWYGRLYRGLLVERLGLEFEESTPSHDTLGRLFSLIDGGALIACFEGWMAQLHQATQGEVVALDGKTLRGSFDSATGQSTLHLLSAFACQARLVLGIEEALSVGQEVEAMHALLARLELHGRTVTLDDSGHYLLALKASYRQLHDDVEAFFSWLEASPTAARKLEWIEEQELGRRARAHLVSARRTRPERAPAAAQRGRPLPRPLWKSKPASSSCREHCPKTISSAWCTTFCSSMWFMPQSIMWRRLIQRPRGPHAEWTGRSPSAPYCTMPLP